MSFFPMYIGFQFNSMDPVSLQEKIYMLHYSDGPEAVRNLAGNLVSLATELTQLAHNIPLTHR